LEKHHLEEEIQLISFCILYFKQTKSNQHGNGIIFFKSCKTIGYGNEVLFSRHWYSICYVMIMS